MAGRTVRGTNRRVVLALLALTALAASSCFADIAAEHQRTSPDTRPWFCNASGDGRPPGGHGNGNHVYEAYQGRVKGPLSWDDCTALAAQLDAVVSATRAWPTKGAAEADGWMQVAQYIPGLGTHHARGLGLSSAFDPAKPTFLIYGGSQPSAPLVGVAYGSTNTNGVPPEGFAGGNDWYHLHDKVCMRGAFEILAGAETISDDQCRSLGGSQFPLNLFLLHLWVIPGSEYQVDLFSSGHPCLLATGRAPDDDPCWADARRDPATVPTTGTTAPNHPDHGG